MNNINQNKSNSHSDDDIITNDNDNDIYSKKMDGKNNSTIDVGVVFAVGGGGGGENFTI